MVESLCQRYFDSEKALTLSNRSLAAFFNRYFRRVFRTKNLRHRDLSRKFVATRII